MNDMNTVFRKLFDREPTDAEIRDIFRLQDAFGLGPNDALWGIILALKNNEQIIAAGRQTLHDDVKAAAEAAKTVAESQVSELAAQAVVNIQDKVSEGVKAAAGTAIADSQATRRSISLAAVLALVMVALFTGGAIQSALDAPRAGTGVMDSLLFAFIDYMSRSGAGYFYISLALGVLLLHDMRHRSIRSFGGFVVSCALIAFGLWPLIAAVMHVIR